MVGGIKQSEGRRMIIRKTALVATGIAIGVGAATLGREARALMGSSQALAASAAGDMQPFHALLEAVRNPFAVTPSNEPFRGPPASPDACYRTFCGT